MSDVSVSTPGGNWTWPSERLQAQGELPYRIRLPQNAEFDFSVTSCQTNLT
jgi:hypothetical protein